MTHTNTVPDTRRVQEGKESSRALAQQGGRAHRAERQGKPDGSASAVISLACAQASRVAALRNKMGAYQWDCEHEASV